MRYTEHTSSSAAPQYFIPRDRSQTIWRVIIGFVIVLGTMLLLNLVPNLVGGEPEASLLSMVAISILCFYIVYLKQQNLDLVTQAEFQNLLFSQAVAVGTSFCLFVKRDGEIVYVNQGLRSIAPEISGKSYVELDVLLNALKLQEHVKRAIQDAVFALEPKSIPISIGYGASHHAINLEIAPLSRPSGYVVIKAITAHTAPAPQEQAISN